MSGRLHLELRAPAAEIIIDAPARRNAFNMEMWAALPGLIAKAEAADGARAVILHGGDTGYFAAGADISEFDRIYADRETAAQSAGIITAALEAIEGCSKPVIAAIEGNCIGGGVSLALACDIRVAGQASSFGVTPARLGLVYPFGDTVRLVRAVGLSEAKVLLFTGHVFGADRALRTGLVDDIAGPDGALALARERAGQIAAVAQSSVRRMKALANRAASPHESAMAEGLQAFIDAATGADFREGYSAFLEKRRPDFPGR